MLRYLINYGPIRYKQLYYRDNKHIPLIECGA